MMRRTCVGRISPRSARQTFTFIAPEGFSHPKTRTHVRLLGPCFKTGRIKPYDRQRPWRVCALLQTDSTEVQVHCTQSTMVTAQAARRGQPNGTHRDSSARPDTVTRGYNTRRSKLPSPETFLPVRALVDALHGKVRRSNCRAKQRQSFGSALRPDRRKNT